MENENEKKIKVLRDQLMEKSPVTRDDLKTMIASLDASTLKKYTGSDQQPTEEEIKKVFEFLGL